MAFEGALQVSSQRPEEQRQMQIESPASFPLFTDHGEDQCASHLLSPLQRGTAAPDAAATAVAAAAAAAATQTPTQRQSSQFQKLSCIETIAIIGRNEPTCMPDLAAVPAKGACHSIRDSRCYWRLAESCLIKGN